jgi:hypothetical protein
MKNFFKVMLAACCTFLISSTVLYAQTSISGKVSDAASGETLAGVNIVVKGKVVGTISNTNGEFSLKVNDAPPFTLVFSFVGFKSVESQITNAATTGLDIKLEEQTVLGEEVVIAASRVEESILDDCPGVSQNRKNLLLRRFGSVSRLRKASVEEIASTEGIGRKLAEDLHRFLQSH